VGYDISPLSRVEFKNFNHFKALAWWLVIKILNLTLLSGEISASG
jgi:hypothetical protein